MSPDGSIGWTFEVGLRPYRVMAEERLDRRGIVYLRWWQDGNWRKRSTGIRVRRENGELVKRRVLEVERAARELHVRITNLQDPTEAPQSHLRLLDGLAQATDPHRGIYPKDTPHRREVVRELRRAATILGNPRWRDLRPADIRELYRKRAAGLVAQGHTGRRGAEVTVGRLLAIAEWLISEELIPPGSCRAPKNWRKKLGAELDDSDPRRPRHTVEELRAVLAVAADVDPRLALALQLGAELRLGQVIRMRRSDLDLATDMARVRGAGNKRGVSMMLIPPQREAVDAALAGYLAPLEAQREAGTVSDYPLFPAGPLTGRRVDPRAAHCRPEQADARPVHRRAVLGWFHAAERLAGITPVEGRGWYGLRRAGVDKAKADGVSREALQKLGGWADSQVPDRIYADQEAESAVVAAAAARAEIRGVGTAKPYPKEPDPDVE